MTDHDREPLACEWCDLRSGALVRVQRHAALLCPRCEAKDAAEFAGEVSPPDIAHARLALEAQGFRLEGTGGGCEAYVYSRHTDSHMRGDEPSGTAYVVVRMGDASVPDYMDEPITVAVYPAGTWFASSECMTSYDFASVVAFLSSDLLIRIRTTGEERERLDREDAVAMFGGAHDNRFPRSFGWADRRYEICDEDACPEFSENGTLREARVSDIAGIEWRAFDVLDFLRQEGIAPEDVAAVAALDRAPYNECTIGGGAAPAFIVRRVS